MDKKRLLILIGLRIKELREQKGVSQQELASDCNFEKSNMSRLESGNTNPTIYTLSKIANALNVELFELLKIKEQEL